MRYGHKVVVRKDRQNKSHIHCTLFMNRGNVGHLTFTVDEYRIFLQLLESGASMNNAQMPPTEWPSDGIEVEEKKGGGG